MTPSLSFLIPVYNVQEFLDECVTSVLPATQAGDEIILLDDGSVDGSSAMCDAWALRHPDRIRVIHQANVGLATIRNRAVQISTCDYICFLDSDDVLCWETLAAARELLTREHLDLLTCDAILWRQGPPSLTISHSLPTDAVISGTEALAHTLQDDFLSSCCRIYSRALLCAAGPEIFPASRTYEDNSAIPLLISHAQRVAYLPMPLFLYRVRGGSITQTHTLKRCLDQATSLALPLKQIRQLQTDPALRDTANLLALSHVVTAVRHAATIPKVTLRDFTQVIEAGVQSLTLRGDALLAAVDASPRKKVLRKHAKGMLQHPRRYALLRLLVARWKQFHVRLTQRTP